MTIRVADRDAAERFYATVLGTLGIERVGRDGSYVRFGGFALAQATAEQPVTRGLHVGFVAPSEAAVDAFWAAGTAAGHPDDGPPGPRPRYRDDYYGAFLLDPDGNSAEAVRHGALRTDGIVDHLWIRVADLPAATRFYTTIAPYAGLRLALDMPERVRFAAASKSGGSLTLVAGSPPSADAHIAFPARDRATVDAFHAAALAAGHRDHGAFVSDPDGNSVEVVDHGR